MARLEIKTDGTVEGTTITDDSGAAYASAVSVSVKGGPMESVSIVADLSAPAASADLPVIGISGDSITPDSETAVTTSAPKKTREKKEE